MADEDEKVVDFESSKDGHRQKQKEKKVQEVKRRFETFLPLKKKQPRVFKKKRPKKK